MWLVVTVLDSESLQDLRNWVCKNLEEKYK